MNRTRTRGSISSKSDYLSEVKDSNCSQPNWVQVGSSPSMATGTYETMSDVLVPGFHKRRQGGEIFFNPMSRRVETVKFSGGVGPEVNSIGLTCASPAKTGKTRWGDSSAAFVHPSIGGNPTALLPPLEYLISSSTIDNAMTEASTRVYSEIGRGGSNLFESIAEYRQTAGMIRDIYQAGNRSIDRYILRDVDLRNAPRNIAKRTNNAYLMYRYGIKPMINDIQTIIDGMSKSTGRKRETVRGFANFAESKTAIVQSSAYGSGILVQIRKQTTDSVKVRGMALTEYVAYWGDNYGLSAKNLLTVPWELIPYSFVVDWFVNVGDFIGAAVPTPGTNTLGSCIVIEQRTETTCTIENCTGGPSYTVPRQPAGTASYEVVSKSRTGLRAPSIVVKSDFGFDRDTRVADAVALVTQKIKLRPELRVAFGLVQQALLNGSHASF